MKKRILICLLVIVAAFSCLLVACDNKPTECEHTYTENWVWDEQGHWKECTKCGEIDPKYGKLTHSYDGQGQCKRCDYRRGSKEIEVRDGNVIYTEKADGSYEVKKLLDTSANVKSAIIPATVNGKPVTSLSEGAFVIDLENNIFNENIEQITLPEGLLAIGPWAFFGCEKLKSVNVPSTVTKIGQGAFNRCSSLTEVIIPDNATDVDSTSWFVGCTKLEHVKLGKGVKTIGWHCFENCASLTNVELGDGIINFDEFAFYNCTSLTTITLPASLTTIGSGSFYGCSSLTTVNFGANSQVTLIGEGAFQGCSSITSLVCPANLVEIGQTAFNGCTALTSVEFNDKLEKIGAGAFILCANIGKLDLPYGLQKIGFGAFYGLSKIKSLVVPDTVTDIGIYFLFGCNSLEELTVPFVGGTMQHRRNLGYFFDENVDDSQTLVSRSEEESNRDSVPKSLKTLTITKATGIGDYAFTACEHLTTINIPGTINFVGVSAFRGTNLSNVIVESGAIYIGSETNKHLILIQAADDNITSCNINASTKVIAGGAFADCANLKSVTIPEGLVSVGSNAFGDRANSVPLNYTKEGNIEYIGTQDNPYMIAVRALEGGSAKTYTINNRTKIIAGSAFASCIVLEEITIPASVQSIGASAFANCRSLKSIVIPDTVLSIENKAFNACEALTEITVGNGVLAIDGDAFYNCKSIEKASIPCAASICMLNIKSTLKELHITSGDTIAEGSFSDFPALEQVIIDDNTVKVIEDGAFYASRKVTSIRLPQGLEKIGESAFAYMTALTGEIVIPETVTYIGDAAFDWSSAISKIVIGKNVNHIGYRAFSYIYEVKFEVAEGNEKYYSYNNCIIDKDTKTLITGGTTGDMPLDGSVEAIADWAFSGRRRTAISIDKSVKRIGEGALTFTNISVINFNGTMAEWKAMYRHAVWFTDGPNSTLVKCTDGNLSV